METKNYKTIKIRNYIKNNNIIFFFNGINQKSNELTVIEHAFKNLQLEYYMILNKLTTKCLKNSIYKNIYAPINGSTFLTKTLSKQLSKKQILNTTESLLFKLLSVKLNNKFYSYKQLQNIYLLEYKKNKLLLYQFCLTNIKFFSK